MVAGGHGCSRERCQTTRWVAVMGDDEIVADAAGIVRVQATISGGGLHGGIWILERVGRRVGFLVGFISVGLRVGKGIRHS